MHEGRIFSFSVDRVRFPDGRLADMEMIRHPGASAVVPFLDDPHSPDPRILLIRQYRYAAGGAIYEIPAGLPDGPDEGWDACALRELEEETGYRARRLEYLTRVYTTPGFTDEVIRLYAAWDLERGTTGHDHDEFIDVTTMPFSRAIELVRVGELVDVKSVAALLFTRNFLLRGAGGAEGTGGTSP